MTGPEPISSIVARVRAEFLEMPGLSLTTAEAARFLGLEPVVAAEVLGGLLRSGFLARTDDDRFVHRGTVAARLDGAGRSATVQMGNSADSMAALLPNGEDT